MNDLDKYEARKIEKRIEIRQNNLKILQPQVNFIQFIEELEKFQQIIDGVDTDDSIPHVQLPLVRSRFEFLQCSYKKLLQILTEDLKRIEQRPVDILLTDLFTAIHESTLLLIANQRNFHTQTLASSDLIYNIRTIFIIQELLNNLEGDVSTVKKNFNNLQKSTNKQQVKETLKNIYARALAFSSLKFEYFARFFSKFGQLTRHRFRFAVYKLRMAEEAPFADLPGEEAPIVDLTTEETALVNGTTGEATLADGTTGEAALVDETTDGHALSDFAGRADDPNKENQSEINTTYSEPIPIYPTVAAIELDNTNYVDAVQAGQESVLSLIKKEEQVEMKFVTKEPTKEILHEADANDHSQYKLTSHSDPSNSSSILELEENLKKTLQSYCPKINAIFTNLSKLQAQIKETIATQQQYNRTLKHEMQEVERQKRTIAEDPEFTEEEKMKKLQDIAIHIGQLTGLNEERIEELESQKRKLKERSLQEALKLNDIKQNFLTIKQKTLDILKKDNGEIVDEKTVQIINQAYDEELGVLRQIENVEKFEIDNDGVYFSDEANMKTYFSSIGVMVDRKMSTSNQGVPKVDDKEIPTPSKHMSRTHSLGSASEMARASSLKSAVSGEKEQRDRGSLLTTGSSYSREEELQEQLPLDNENYIKHTLGKPLRQALAAITVYQPSDPINYLANYLLQYRYNELRNIQRQQEFENLLTERENFAKRVQQEHMRRERQMKGCDPCNPTRSDQL